MVSLGHQVCQTWPCSKHTMLIWDMVGFGIICLKPNHDPNVSMLIWNMVGFGVSSVPNLTMFQIWFGISQVGFGCWSHFGHGYSQIENYDLGCPKSKFRFGDVPNQIRNKVAFGLQQRQSFLLNQIHRVSIIASAMFLPLWQNSIKMISKRKFFYFKVEPT